MALTQDYIKSTYPLPVYNYRVTVLDGMMPTVIGFSEVSGLGMECQPVVYKHGFSFASGPVLIPGMVQTHRLILKKGLTGNGNFLQKWIEQACADPYSAGAKRDVVVDLCDEVGLPMIRWTLLGALPVKLDAPTFSAGSNEVAIASMELIAGDLKVDYQLF